MIGAPLLILLLAIPAIAAIVVALLPSSRAGLRGPIARAAAWAVTGWSALVAARFEIGVATPQFAQRWPWLSGLGEDGRFALAGGLGLDGLNLPVVATIALLTPLALRLTAPAGDRREREFWVAALVLEFAALGAALSLDAALFAAFVSVAAIPMLLIVGIWGGRHKLDAATQTASYTFIGAIAFAAAGIAGLDATAPSGSAITLGLIGAVLLVPLFPAHRALTTPAIEGPPHALLWTTAVVPMVGLIALTRFLGPAMAGPHSVGQTVLLGLTTFSALYAALLALRAKDANALVALAVASQIAIAVAGAATGRASGITGAVFHGTAVALGGSGLALVMLALRRRRGSSELERFGGLAAPMPLATLAFVVFAAGLTAVPGSPGFVGTWLILDALADVGWGWVAMAALAQVVLAAALLSAFRQTMLGPCSKRNAKLEDLDSPERTVALVLIAAVLVLGLVPRLAVSRIEPTAAAVEANR